MPEPHGHPDLSGIGIETVFSALANPARAHIVVSLLTRDRWTAESCTSFNLSLSRSSLTHHIRVMSDAGLVIEYDHGNRCEVTLRKEELDERFPGLLDLVRQGAQERATS